MHRIRCPRMFSRVLEKLQELMQKSSGISDLVPMSKQKDDVDKYEEFATQKICLNRERNLQ